MKLIKKTIPSIFLTGILGAFIVSKDVLAHDIIGLLTKSTNATAVYNVTCSPFVPTNTPTAYLVVDIENKTKNATYLDSVTAVKDGITSITTTDPKNGDNRKSIPASMSGGDGIYTLTVSKLKKKPKQPNSMLKGNSIFAMTFHCESTDGVHTQTDYTRLR